MDVPEILQQILAASWWPGASRVSRYWHAQFDILLQGASEPKNQVEIVAACRTDDWLGLVRLARRAGAANYFYLWHTRCKVHMFCSVEMIRFYEMIFCDARPSEIDDSLRLAPKYLALNRDPQVWEMRGRLSPIDVNDAIVQASPHVTASGPIINKYLLLSGQYDRLPEKVYSMHAWECGECALDAYPVVMNDTWATLFGMDFVRRGEFNIANDIRAKYPFAKLVMSSPLGLLQLTGSEYLEGIDYLLSMGFTPDFILQSLQPDISKKWATAHINKTTLPEGSRGRQDLLTRSTKVKRDKFAWLGIHGPPVLWQ